MRMFASTVIVGVAMMGAAAATRIGAQPVKPGQGIPIPANITAQPVTPTTIFTPGPWPVPNIGDRISITYRITSFFNNLVRSTDELASANAAPLVQEAAGYVVQMNPGGWLALARCRLNYGGRTYYSDFFSIPWGDIQALNALDLGAGRGLPPIPPPTTTLTTPP